MGMFCEVLFVCAVNFRIIFINLNLGCVNFEMSWEVALSSVNFATLVALERLLPSVFYNVALQITRRGTCVVALVTLVWPFSCVVLHHVNFQITSCNAGILTHCASVRLFSRVSPFAGLQMA